MTVHGEVQERAADEVRGAEEGGWQRAGPGSLVQGLAANQASEGPGAAAGTGAHSIYSMHEGLCLACSLALLSATAGTRRHLERGACGSTCA